MKSSVIVPVHNGETYLRKALPALVASTRAPAEIIVVDDGSTDGTGDLARSFGATVVSLPGGPHGPAAARNRGAEEATGDILVFLDADVAVHTTTLERIADHFAVAPDVAALFGSYDDRPAEPGIVSRYKNLLHHFTHQHSRADAKTFWAGCGAIRREVFVECGGFDERFRRPSIEDIDLGLRLCQAGHRIRSCPEIQATHLKRWTLAGLIHTDVFLRAIPWSRLILRSGSLADDLNTSRSSRYSALAAWVLAIALFAGAWLPWAFLGLLPALVILQVCNARLLALMYRCGGIRFAAAASILHLLYYLYGSLAFALIAAEHAIDLHRVRPLNKHPL
jgi:glycosyltransferase involved in cell wall biosynthesis